MSKTNPPPQRAESGPARPGQPRTAVMSQRADAATDHADESLSRRARGCVAQILRLPESVVSSFGENRTPEQRAAMLAGITSPIRFELIDD